MKTTVNTGNAREVLQAAKDGAYITYTTDGRTGRPAIDVNYDGFEAVEAAEAAAAHGYTVSVIHFGKRIFAANL